MSHAAPIRQLSLDEARELGGGAMPYLSGRLTIIDRFEDLEVSGEKFQPAFLVFGICTAGSAEVWLGEREVRVTCGDLLLCVGQSVMSWQSKTDDFRAMALLVSRECLADSIMGLHQLWPYLRFIYKEPVVHLDADSLAHLHHTYDFMRYRLSTATSRRFLGEQLSLLLRMAYFDVCGILEQRYPDTQGEHAAGYAVFDRFLHLLDEHFREQRSVTWYSDRLCLTPKYLSEVVKAVSGQTAGQWITTFVISEAKRLLTDTSLSVKEIAQALHFTSQSFLGKYFKNATGLSPSDYRHELEK